MSIQEKFKSILETNSFEQLASYKEPMTWATMTKEERELLGILFVKQGEHQLNQGDSKVLESFEWATKVAPCSPLIYFKQALVYATQGQNIRCLKAADTALGKATDLDPAFFNAWHSWGNILVRIGAFYDDPIYYQQADEKFAEAERLRPQANLQVAGSLYWQWGICWYFLGKQSGEAVDFFHSLTKFRLAEEQGFENGEFHHDYGNILIDLGCLIGRETLFIEAVDHYEKAISLESSTCENWLNLACTYQRLYDFTTSRDYFYKADECFERAATKSPEDPVIWLRWAELYVNAGKISRSLDRLQESLEKFKRSETIEPGNPHVLLRWSEAQILLASFKEDLELLRDAQTKVKDVLKLIPQNPEAWYVYGFCLSELGRYFNADEYYSQAIDKFKQGLELNGSHPLLLHGLALAYFSIGELKSDVEAVKTSIVYFGTLAELGERLFPQFLSDWGVSLMKLGEMTSERSHIEEAAAKFEGAISFRFDALQGEEDIELEWLYNYGCAMDFLGDFHEESVYYEKAIQVLAHVLKLDPDYTYARYNLALALSHLGELDGEVESFHQSIELFYEVIARDPEDEIAYNDCGVALLNLAFLTTDPIHFEKAQDFFRDAEIKLQQAVALGSLHAYYNLACLYALTHNPSGAVHYLEKAEECDVLPPTDDVIHDEWLDGLRDQPAYRLFISRLLNKQEEI